MCPLDYRVAGVQVLKASSAARPKKTSDGELFREVWTNKVFMTEDMLHEWYNWYQNWELPNPEFRDFFSQWFPNVPSFDWKSLKFDWQPRYKYHRVTLGNTVMGMRCINKNKGGGGS